MTKQLFLVTALAAALSACTLAPTYQRPASPVGAFPTGGAFGDNTAQGKTLAADIGWQDFFADARLQKLIELSLQNNRDLRVAVLQVEQARAQYQIQRADLFPTINAAAQGTRAHTPANMNTSGREVTGNSFSANLGFTSYELDLFGRVQSLKNAALESYFGTAEAQKTAQITLVSEVASQYLTVLSAEAQLDLANETLKSYQSSFDLTKRRFDVGAASALDLASVQSQLNTAQGAAAQAIQQKAQAENALAFLIGQPLPADLPPEPKLGDEQMLADLPAGLSSDLLERRPDIVQAEHALKAANANIGAARAAFFPTISLTGAYGSSSPALSGLFGSGQSAWSFGPSITMPIFDGGRNSANLDVANTQQKIAVANYEKSIQSAFREVSDGLVARHQLDDQIKAQSDLVQAESTRYNLSQLRYDKGVDSYLSTLDSQRSLFSAQQSLISLQLSRLTNLVSLYKSLGGGWVSKTDEAPAEVASK